MSKKEAYIRTNLQNYANMYKIIASIALFGIAQNDFEIIQRDYLNLKKLYNRITDFVKTVCSKDVVNNFISYDMDNLPEYLSPLKTVDTYNKILALKYTETELNSAEEAILVNKMSIELNCDEEIPYINLAHLLYKNQKYPEIIELWKTVKGLSDTAPMWEILGKTYRALGSYGEAIKALKKYLELNENDTDALDFLNETYEEALT